MAAPAATARQTPSGMRLTNGFSSKITVKRFPAISLWEVSGTPPGWDGGEMIDITTMHNTRFRQMYPRSLISLTESSWTVAYDPNVHNTLDDAIGVNDEFTVTFRDGSTEAFWGVLRQFTPQELADGTMPLATMVISPTNSDNSLAEQAPVIASVSGT